jgi:hypothetical protein
VKARDAISLRYTGNPRGRRPGHAGAGQGVINYAEHIQPLWTRDRAGGSCLRCHASGSLLDLSGTVAGSGRLASYDNLLIGPPLLDASGRVQTRLDEGVPVVVRAAPLVDTAASEGEAIRPGAQEPAGGDPVGPVAEGRQRRAHGHPTPARVDHAGR